MQGFNKLEEAINEAKQNFELDKVYEFSPDCSMYSLKKLGVPVSLDRQIAKEYEKQIAKEAKKAIDPDEYDPTDDPVFSYVEGWLDDSYVIVYFSKKPLTKREMDQKTNLGFCDWSLKPFKMKDVYINVWIASA